MKSFLIFLFLSISKSVILSDNQNECVLFQSGVLAELEWKHNLPGLYDDSPVI